MQQDFMIDLHTHSHFSDGLLSVPALYQKAIDNGLSMLALTDHDTVSGVKSLITLAEQSSLRIISGIELSVRFKTKDVHILGLNLDLSSEALCAVITKQQDSRLARAQEIARKLTDSLGMSDVWTKVCAIAGHEHIARPHFAQLLQNEGKVKDFQKAFKQYLARGRVAFVSTVWINIAEAVHAIHAAGGVAVIAHPLKYGLTKTKLNELILAFRACGGEGLEVVSGDTSADDIALLAKLSVQYDMLASTGSDFHGQGLSRYDLGKQAELPSICKPIWQLWTN